MIGQKWMEGIENISFINNTSNQSLLEKYLYIFDI